MRTNVHSDPRSASLLDTINHQTNNVVVTKGGMCNACQAAEVPQTWGQLTRRVHCSSLSKGQEVQAGQLT